MADNNKQDPKKSASSPIIFIVMGLILAMILMQNFLETKVAHVAFSYQLEHLVNLDLIQPEECRKTASANNLVAFSGKFRDAFTEEGKNRYKYLEVLDTSHELESEKVRLEEELSLLRKKVSDATGLYLKILGEKIPSSGFAVFDEFYDTPDRENRIIVRQALEKNIPSIKDVEARLQDVSQATAATDAGKKKLLEVEQDLEVVIRNLRSPLLGIGNETTKQELKKLESSLQESKEMQNGGDQYALVKTVMDGVKTIIVSLGAEKEHIRLGGLRSCRRYREALDELQALGQRIEDNSMKLEKIRPQVASMVWYFNNQEMGSRALEKQDSEAFHAWFLGARDEWQNFEHNRNAIFKAPDQPVNKVLEKVFRSEELTPNYLSYLLSIAPVFLILLLLYFAFSRQMKGMGGAAMDFSKSPARLYPKGSTKVTFKDVAGIEECLEELQEVVEFLKSPQKFTSLGGRIPKGVLTIGPPGTGKTLVAKAVAGEADCPFFSISGSDFVEMFVGVGASRIRKMFEEAKRNAPCIIFIDEIDAVGRHRGGGIGGGHDEREQTLNQLLVEMDGFDTQEGIIIIAATNRPDVLDKALLRPGRFDRQVYIPLPDIKGRFEILKVHARKIKLDAAVDLMLLARSTPGSSGADLENMLNEAALLAARKGRTAVTEPDIFEARDKVLYGKERRSLEVDAQEKKTTAYHESGHTIVSAHSKHADPIDKVTIIPRGYSLGSTLFVPKKNRLSYWKRELLDQLAVLMGGRVAEELFVGDISSGAKQDIERATQIARSMVCEWGMSDILGTVTYDERSENGQLLGLTGWKEKMYSEKTAQEIDAEIRKLLDEAYARAKTIMIENKDVAEQMSAALIEFETLDSEDVAKMVRREWNPEEKKTKITNHAAAHIKPEVTPPPPPPLEAKEPPPSTIKPIEMTT